MTRRKPPQDEIPEQIAPQLVTLVDAPPKSPGRVYDIKLDGYRILARCEGGKARLITRRPLSGLRLALRLVK